MQDITLVQLKKNRVKKYLAKANGADNVCEDAQVVSCKLNSLRAPRFRVNTFIRDEEDGRKVIKSPDSPEASEQIERIVRGCDILHGTYKRVEVLDYVRRDDSLVFPFIEGESLLDGVSASSDPIDDIVKAINGAMDIIFDFNSEPVGFVETDRFRANFPGLHPDASEPSYPVINMDSNIDNFIRSEDKVYLVDSEWVADYPLPVRFVKFRLLLDYYLNNHDALSGRIKRSDFLKLFGFDKKDIKLFSSMECCFQIYVVDLGYKESRF